MIIHISSKWAAVYKTGPYPWLAYDYVGELFGWRARVLRVVARFLFWTAGSGGRL